MELECGYSPQDKTNRNLIFSAPLYQHWPWPWPLLENQPWEEHCSETLCVPPPFYRHLLITHTHILITNYYTYTHIYMHSLPHPRSLASVALNRQPDKRVCDQRRKWLQERMADCQSWITSPVAKSCVYGVLCAFVAEVFFLFSHCTPQGA